jgi:two-component system response regulator PilR (NtrC family)
MTMAPLPTEASAPPRPPRAGAYILVVDDEPDLRTLYELTLLREGYRVETGGTLAQAQALLQEHRFDAVISDMRLPDGLGLALLHGLRAQQRPERFVVMTAYGSAENAVEALKAGAFDYLTKPVDLKQFRAVVASAVQEPAPPAPRAPARPGAARPATSDRTAGAQPVLDRLVGESDAMRQVKQRILKVARGMAPVLVRGESGTGKELVAQALHACSHRASGPLVAVNCGAIPENLLEAEFFGARKGSYTGALADRPGYFQAARGGTLFLDEIGDLPLSMQSKLLRSIQERAVRPVGAVAEVAVDVRILSATHKDLGAEVHASRFRQDLYYRLNVIQVRVPPLRERLGDLSEICTRVLERIAADAGVSPAPRLTHEALARLSHYPFPGNVRELENLLHRALALSGGELIDAVDLGLPDHDLGGDTQFDTVATLEAHAAVAEALKPVAEPRAAEAALPTDLAAHLDNVERDILVRALEHYRYNRTAAGASMGLSLRQMRYRMARLGIHVADQGVTIGEPHDVGEAPAD